MSEIPRRNIQDLQAKYVLEPVIKDVYVEGVFDKDIINTWCRKNNDDSMVVFNIDVIDVPENILRKHSMTEGNKQRVMALAKELEGLGSNSYSCLVDRDLDHWFDAIETIPRLSWTEYCSLELYFFNEDLIKDILIDVSNAKISLAAWPKVYSSFVNVLKVVYSIRLADCELAMNLSLLELDKFLSVRKGEVFFEKNDFVVRTLNKNSKMKHKAEFTECYEKWESVLKGDPRLYIRGHDYVELLAWMVKGFKGIKEYQSEKTIERIFNVYFDRISNLVSSLGE